MKITNCYYCLLIILCVSINISKTHAQCEWLYEEREPESYTIEDDGTPVLFYCSNDTAATIYAPTPIDVNGTILYDYITTEWHYSQDTLNCVDIDNYPAYGSVFQPLATNSACITDTDEQFFTVHFIGKNQDNSLDTCTFKMLFFESASPEIVIYDAINTYNSGETPVLCEETMIDNQLTLTATGLGSNPPTFEHTEYQWYLGGNLIEGANSISLEVSTIDYSINDPGINTFSFSILNFCSGNPVTGETITMSPSRSIVIYEGYGDECDPCQWNFPNYEANQFYIFTPNEDGVADYFPEPPNNEANRINEIQETLSQPTCEATIYRLSIYNRIGRELFTSEYDNHPWDGRLNNGRQCKEGTYFYKIEYILNPHVPDYEQDQTKVATGTVYLDSGN